MAVRSGVALLGAVMLLAGCAPVFEPPPGITEDEYMAMAAQSNKEWWVSTFPDEPPPEVEIEYFTAELAWGRQNQCVLESGIPGIAVVDGQWTFDSPDDETTERFYRIQYACTVRYQVAWSEAEKIGYFSPAQQVYLADFYSNRLRPCLRMLGYTLGSSGLDYSAPYWQMDPYPQTDGEWARVDLECPPPAIGFHP